jgi:serine/threonine-protein kinase
VFNVVGHLSVELREEERLKAARRSTADLEAYELYMRGMQLSASNDRADIEAAISLFQRAIDRDPEFVSPYVEVAKRQSELYLGFGLRSEERAAAARDAAARALELAPGFDDAQLAMGIYLYRVEKDYQAALEKFGRASGSLLGDFDFHRHRGWTLRRLGQWREALASFEAANALSPRVAGPWLDLGLTHMFMRRYADAEQAFADFRSLNGGPTYQELFYRAVVTWNRDGSLDGFRPFLDQSPDDHAGWEVAMCEGRYQDAADVLANRPEVFIEQQMWYPRELLEAETLDALGQTEAARAKFAAAAEILERMVDETPEDERYHASLAWALAGLGRSEAAVEEALTARDLLPRAKDSLMGSRFLFDLAAVYARLGEVENALEALEDLLSAPSWFSPYRLEDEFRLRPIRDDPRFRALMDRERDRVF